MIIFAHPQFLLLLLLIPFFFIGLAVWMGARRRRLRKLGDEDLVNELMPSWSRSKRWVRAVIYSLAFLFFVIGLSRPQIGAKLKEYKARGAEIMIALDVSNSMLAQDYSPNRLERAKLAISRITDKLQDDRIGLIIFAGFDVFINHAAGHGTHHTRIGKAVIQAKSHFRDNFAEFIAFFDINRIKAVLMTA
jgi:Ca-activated chloride channel family protein